MRDFLAGTACLVLAVAPASAAIVTNPFNDRVLHLDLADRNGALRRAVTLEDQSCGRLASSVFRGYHGNLGLWQVRCVPGGDYGVFLGPDGSVQVRTCADMATLNLPKCIRQD